MIKFSKNNISKIDIKNCGSVIKSGWLTHGKYTSLFEKKFCNFTSAKYAVSVSSCTAALHLSCLASNFKKGDEIIVPAQTHTATAHAIEYTGAKAVIVDIDFETGNLKLKEIKKKITKKTKGVIIVHMAGYPCDIDEIKKYCKKKKITLIEDCAHALGTYKKNRHVGNFGLSGCFSFYPTKQITTGEGGMIITNNLNFYKKIKLLKAFGIDKDIKERKTPGDYDVKFLGFNYRMTDFQAALGYGQLIKYSKNLTRRHQIAKRYIKNLSNVSGLKTMPYSKDCSFFVFQIFSKKKQQIINALKNKNCGFSIHYQNCLAGMSYYKKKYKLNLKNFKNSLNYGQMNISLPVYPALKNKEIDFICKKILDSLK
jgi:dTDP-4-amino-4,6-dideoxygalactose transaminase